MKKKKHERSLVARIAAMILLLAMIASFVATCLMYYS